MKIENSRLLPEKWEWMRLFSKLTQKIERQMRRGWFKERVKHVCVGNRATKHRPPVDPRFYQPCGKGFELHPTTKSSRRPFSGKAKSSTSSSTPPSSRIFSLSHLHRSRSCDINMSENFVPPNQQRNLRACMVCSIVMTQNVRLHLAPSPPRIRLADCSSDFWKKDAQTAKNSSISKAAWTPLSTAHPKSLKAWSRSQIRARAG